MQSDDADGKSKQKKKQNGKHDKRSGKGRYASVLIFGACLSAAATAEVREPAAERGSLMLAAFQTGRTTDARLDSDSRSGTDIDMEDDLGLERYMTVARLSGYVWITQRQRIDFSLFDLSREGSEELDKEITLGDKTFAIDTDVKTLYELVLQARLHVRSVEPGPRFPRRCRGPLRRSYRRRRQRLDSAGRPSLKQLTAPLPVFGLRGEYAFGERFTLRGAAELFAIETGGIDGRLHDSYVGVDYSFAKRFALGVAYNDVSMNVAAQEAGFHGRLDAGYQGALLYFKVDFGATR